MIACYNSPHYNADTFNQSDIGNHSYLFDDVIHQLDRRFYYSQSQKMLGELSKASSIRNAETDDSIIFRYRIKSEILMIMKSQ